MSNKKIAILLTPGFADWEYGLLAGTGAPFYGLDIRFFTPHTGEILSQGGLPARIDSDTDALVAWSPAALAVVGGTLWETDEAPDVSSVVQKLHAAGSIIAGICGGTLVLARAGLLDTVEHTSNSLDFLQQNAPEYRGSNRYRDRPAAVSKNRVISAPGTAPVSFTAAIFHAVGMEDEQVAGFAKMMAAEHA